MGFNVAIDGPAGAGKSTVAKMISKEMGFIYVDTGAMFRAIGIYFLRNNINPEDDDAVAEACKKIDVGIVYENGTQQVLLNGENVTGQLRTQEVGDMASRASVNPNVRNALLELQRKLARENDVVMDGRDIGTVVLPNADLKIYLTASSRIRAIRRVGELKEKGIEADLDVTEQEIIERDNRDMNREVAPLKQADDAVLVNTDEMDADAVCAKLMAMVKERKG
ncbi:MAG: (d)CMP kinase [Lachnospiraceae bacterium]|nr:(d)CMP kinase [Lachnospiraceae bacterium]